LDYGFEAKMNTSLALGILFLSIIVGPAVGQDAQVRVYRLDGSLQCGMGQARTLADDGEILTKLGARVISQEKRIVPAPVIAVCGAPTGAANTFVISSSDWATISKSVMGPAGFELWDPNAKTVLIYKYDGSVQCGGKEPVSLELMAKELTDAGVNIISQRKAYDGRMHSSVCGAATGAINVYEIDISGLQKARDLNFSILEAGPPRLASSRTRLLATDSTPQASEGLPLPWPFPWATGPPYPWPWPWSPP
jgi:hypothetical protein